MSENKLDKINAAIFQKQFVNGLASHTQSNCQVTLTDDGYRIYRPPNVTYSSSDSSTRTMWGGLVIRPFTDDDNFLIQGHTYILMFHVKGQSSNNCDNYWSNNAGWTGKNYGLTTSPTNVSYNEIGTNFQGEKDIYYKFTVNDSINKTCTTSYSSFVEGNTYNCYRDFKWGFVYDNTGPLGTDIYLTNFRMYDITQPDNEVKFFKTGIIAGSEFVETSSSVSLSSPMQIYSSGEILTHDFIEY